MSEINLMSGMLYAAAFICVMVAAYKGIRKIFKDKYHYPYRAIEIRTGIANSKGTMRITSQFYPERLVLGFYIHYRIERIITQIVTLKPVGPFESEHECSQWVQANWAPRKTREIVKHRITGI